MSHTERNHSRNTKLAPKNIGGVVNRALSLINDAREPNLAIREVAVVVIEAFVVIMEKQPHLTFEEAVMEAQEASAASEVNCETSERKCGRAMAVKALELSAAIKMKVNSYSKALIQMNRIITQREKRKVSNENSQKQFTTTRGKHRNKQRLPKRYVAPRGLAA